MEVDEEEDLRPDVIEDEGEDDNEPLGTQIPDIQDAGLLCSPSALRALTRKTQMTWKGLFNALIMALARLLRSSLVYSKSRSSIEESQAREPRTR